MGFFALSFFSSRGSAQGDRRKRAKKRNRRKRDEKGPENYDLPFFSIFPTRSKTEDRQKQMRQSVPEVSLGGTNETEENATM